MSIDASNSRAILLATQLLERYSTEDVWLQDFEQEIDTARERYTQENDEIDQRGEYPTIDILEEKYAAWSERIESFKQKNIHVDTLASEINQELVRFRRSTIPADIFTTLRFINHEKTQELEEYYSHLRIKVSTLEQHYSRIQNLAIKALREIKWIESHPHRRLLQTIARVRGGQRNPSSISWAADKATRHVSSAYHSLVGAQNSSRPRSQSLPLPSSHSEEEDPVEDLPPAPVVPTAINRKKNKK